MKKEIHQLILNNIFLSDTAKKKLISSLDSLSDNQAKAMFTLLKQAEKNQIFLIESASKDKNFLANMKHEIQQEKRHDDQVREQENLSEEALLLEKIEAEIENL